MHALDDARLPETDPAEWAEFVERTSVEMPRIHGLMTELYGSNRVDAELAAFVTQLAESWQHRPAELRAVDAARLADPDWFQSNQMLGGVCYVDRYAGDLEGVRARIPYFRELGLTYLHLMPLFEAPAENSTMSRPEKSAVPASSTFTGWPRQGRVLPAERAEAK